jgi:hypothetical protein
MAFEFAKNGVLEEGWKGKAAVGAAGLGAAGLGLYGLKKGMDDASDAVTGYTDTAGKHVPGLVDKGRDKAIKSLGGSTKAELDAKHKEGALAQEKWSKEHGTNAAGTEKVTYEPKADSAAEHGNALAQKGIKTASSVASDASTAIGHGIDAHPGVAALAAGAVLGAALRRRKQQNQNQ